MIKSVHQLLELTHGPSADLKVYKGLQRVSHCRELALATCMQDSLLSSARPAGRLSVLNQWLLHARITGLIMALTSDLLTEAFLGLSFMTGTERLCTPVGSMPMSWFNRCDHMKSISFAPAM